MGGYTLLRSGRNGYEFGGRMKEDKASVVVLHSMNVDVEGVVGS